MTKYDVHPNARESIDKAGRELLCKIIEKPSESKTDSQEFVSERPVAATITDKDIGEDFFFGYTDQREQFVSRYFPHEGRLFGLVGDAYQDLRRAVDQVLKIRWAREKLGAKFIEHRIFVWCKESYITRASASLTDYLASLAADVVKPFRIWVPIAFLEVEASFQFGVVTIVPIKREFFEKLETDAIERRPEDADSIKARYERLRRQMLGRAAIVVDLDAEELHAQDQGSEIAEISVALLRMYSPAAYVASMICPCVPLGSEAAPTRNVMSFGPEGEFSLTGSIVKPAPQSWQITAREWNEMRQASFQLLPTLISEEELNEFQRRVRLSVLAYSQGMTLRDPSDRLVYTLSALEGLLLRDESEPIQQNLGERMAFLLEKEADARQEIVRTVRSAYSLRSKYIHHRVSVSDEIVLGKLITAATATFDTAVSSMKQFETTRDFVEAIENRKFGG